MNLYSKVRVLKIASFEGPMILREVNRQIVPWIFGHVFFFSQNKTKDKISVLFPRWLILVNLIAFLICVGGPRSVELGADETYGDIPKIPRIQISGVVPGPSGEGSICKSR